MGWGELVLGTDHFTVVAIEIPGEKKKMGKLADLVFVCESP